jgi:hypothetical protein
VKHIKSLRKGDGSYNIFQKKKKIDHHLESLCETYLCNFHFFSHSLIKIQQLFDSSSSTLQIFIVLSSHNGHFTALGQDIDTPTMEIQDRILQTIKIKDSVITIRETLGGITK